MLHVGQFSNDLNDRQACRPNPSCDPPLCSRVIEGVCRYGKGQKPEAPCTPPRRTNKGVVAVRFLGVLTANFTNASAHMGTALNLVEDSLQPYHEAGGYSPHVTNNMTTLTSRVCLGIKFSKFTQYDIPLDPEPVTPSPTKKLDAARSHVRVWPGLDVRGQ